MHLHFLVTMGTEFDSGAHIAVTGVFHEKSSRGGLHSWQIHPEISPSIRLCIVSVLHAGQNMYFSAIFDPKKMILIKFGVLKTNINAKRKNLLEICGRLAL